MTTFINVNEDIDGLLEKLNITKEMKNVRAVIRRDANFIKEFYHPELARLMDKYSGSHGNHFGRYLHPKQNNGMAERKEDSACGLVNTHCINWHIERSLKFVDSCKRKFWFKYSKRKLPKTEDPFFEARPAIALYNSNFVTTLLETNQATSYEELPHMECDRVVRLTPDIEIHVKDRNLVKSPDIIVTTNTGFSQEDLEIPEHYQEVLEGMYPDTTFVNIISDPKYGLYGLNKAVKTTHGATYSRKRIPTSGEETLTYNGFVVANIINNME
ncbi:MAG: hypothetical protein H8D23_28990 [Candidatus Brocadiales bacterium]|nr:hypothetical protein [Candidatus Brocadiales bacterium]